MKAMILAAGRGLRMGTLTEKTPKPLLKVRGRHLIEHSILALSQAGIKEIVINISYLKQQIKDALGDGSRYGIKIFYSEEETRLETGGGVVNALPLLGQDPFIILSGDIITDYPLARLSKIPLRLAHLVLVPNPSFHLQGDYCLNEEHEIYIDHKNKTFTFGNIGIYRPELFTEFKPEYCRLANLWQKAIAQKQITGECYQGLWYNVGTPLDLDISHHRAREDSNL